FHVGDAAADGGMRDELALRRARDAVLLADGDEQAQRGEVEFAEDVFHGGPLPATGSGPSYYRAARRPDAKARRPRGLRPPGWPAARRDSAAAARPGAPAPGRCCVPLHARSRVW